MEEFDVKHNVWLDMTASKMIRKCFSNPTIFPPLITQGRKDVMSNNIVVSRYFITYLHYCTRHSCLVLNSDLFRLHKSIQCLSTKLLKMLHVVMIVSKPFSVYWKTQTLLFNILEFCNFTGG